MFKTLKKFVATSTVALLTATAIVPTAFAAEHPFTDVNDRYEEAVSFLYENEIINGKTETSFGTSLNLTRGDAAVILANTLMLDTENAPDAGFKDLNARVKGAVNALTAEGIVSGTTKDTFSPSVPLSRGAMAKFLNLGFYLEDFATETPFTDVAGVFAPHIEALYGTEITSGKTPTKFGTYDNITRGEFANLLYKTILFVSDNMYMPIAQSANIVNPTTIEIKMDEAAIEDITAEELAELFYVDIEFKDGSTVQPTYSKATISEDRMTLTVEFAEVSSLVGKAGTLYIDDLELTFDFEAK
ncbi:S-layer homology domain-containing protein [Peribacillus acanthi]|uniref:S-layer homology domain-containing protein n=1 Tax=Peribacillus acanthi TaxID=2171554 RepID=UPI000D3EA64B|nr:S-layer homology domain-containing protein [Peribacillus acanthi]